MSSKNILLTSLYPNEKKGWIRKNAKGLIGNANNNLQWSLVKGLKKNNYKFTVLNYMNIGSYPSKNKKIFIKKSVHYHNDIKIINLGFINIIGLKHIIIAFQIFLYSIKNKINQIIIYDLNPAFIISTYFLKKSKICLYIPDLIGFTGRKVGLITKLRRKILYRNLKFIKHYVYISKYMHDIIKNFSPFSNYIVIEGMITLEKERKSAKQNKSELKKYFLYTGALEERHGILKLIKCFENTELEDVLLYLCGEGGLVEYLKTKSKENQKIKYLGQLPKEDILHLQNNALALINPRISKEEFTKYSFPSKTIEYLTSFRPTIMYKLDGIPEEYFEYVFTPKNESDEELINTLINVATYDEEKLSHIGKKAYDFIKREKSDIVQTNKILNFIK